MSDWSEIQEAPQGQGAKVFLGTVESSDWAPVTYDDDVAMYRVCICGNEGEGGSQLGSRVSWIRGQVEMMGLGAPDTNYCLVFSGAVTFKPRTTVAV